MCTATALIILLTNSYNVVDGNTFIIENVPELGFNANLFTQYAVDSVFPGIGSIFVALAIFFFAFTTTLAYYYYSETSVSYLFSKSKYEKIAIWILRIGLLLMAFYGVMNTSKLA
jgi:AGCS family alanine or glycine:cation symporter